MTEPEWMKGAEIVSINHMIVSFTEYRTEDGEDAQVVNVNPTKRIRIDSAIGLLTMAAHLLTRSDDAYLDPEAGDHEIQEGY